MQLKANFAEIHLFESTAPTVSRAALVELDGGSALGTEVSSAVTRSIATRARLFELVAQLPAVAAVSWYFIVLIAFGQSDNLKTAGWIALGVVSLTLAAALGQRLLPELPFQRDAWAIAASSNWNVYVTGVPLFSRSYVVTTEQHIFIAPFRGECKYSAAWPDLVRVGVRERLGVLTVSLVGENMTSTVRLGPRLELSSSGLAFRANNEPTIADLHASGKFAPASWARNRAT